MPNVHDVTPPTYDQRKRQPSTVTIVLAGAPVAKGRPRFTRQGRTYTPAKTKVAEQALVAAWLATTGGTYAPHTGPVSVEFAACFTVPKSWPKWKREAALAGHIPHTVKPDMDNLLKIIDGLNGKAWLDDSQVFNVCGAKYYASDSNTHIKITFWPEVDAKTDQRSKR
jgi:Holliday junction resolvase RusA-like endonuclease